MIIEESKCRLLNKDEEAEETVSIPSALVPAPDPQKDAERLLRSAHAYVLAPYPSEQNSLEHHQFV